MGLAGSGHCLMMCGGIAGAFASQRPSAAQLLIYNLGRITSYCLAGALLGGAFASLQYVTPNALLYLRIFAALLLIVFGLYLGNWWQGLRYIERLGMPLWQRLQPLAKRQRGATRFLPIYSAGLLWGWLPCGLVYSALSWAAVSGSLLNGSLIMLVFGLGTLPAMFAFGWFSTGLQSILRSQGMRKLFGLVMIGYGCWMLFIALRQYSQLF
ncbi:sulfite exporter TauE/SafE family protein [Pseudidiomarina taiwanensis]|uniref:Sulfite exporter TauE/SafE family protein n=2 Tax=Pseudidiomarina taiwanensis TaxID=337250 RepID=A0A432ZPB8_9GAMM|nr:sulfite exporter TauE/SafE family protein [Pseudidiomarina taiwanensis]